VRRIRDGPAAAAELALASRGSLAAEKVPSEVPKAEERSARPRRRTAGPGSLTPVSSG
jgi:hypothetical protein